jgi:aminopeptidase
LSEPSIRPAVRALAAVNLGLRGGEDLLLLADHAHSRGGPAPSAGSLRLRSGQAGLAQDPALVAEIGRHLAEVHPRTRVLVYPSTGRSGVEPPPIAWEAAFGGRTVESLREGGVFERLLDKSADAADLALAEERVRAGAGEAARAVVNLAYHSTTHTSFRRLLTEAAGARFASMPLFERGMFFGPMAVDPGRLAASTRRLASALAGADRHEVRAPNGTDLAFSVAGRPVKADDGDLRAPGAFGNLPAGEVFLAPVEGTGRGVLVIEWGPTSRMERPLVVTVEKGRAAAVEGGGMGEADWLRGLLSAHPHNANLAEIGIGANPGASRPDNVLEAEKILGTVHLALGDNHTFGGAVAAPFHLDFTVFQASLTAVWERGGGRRLLLDRGCPGW